MTTKLEEYNSDWITTFKLEVRPDHRNESKPYDPTWIPYSELDNIAKLITLNVMVNKVPGLIS